MAVILAILLIFILGYSMVQYLPVYPTIETNHTILETRDLVLNEHDLSQLEMTVNDCQTEEQTSYSSNLVQYTFCNYTIGVLNNTEVIIELRKFANFEDLNNAYQYDSSHLYGADGMISENVYGDQSRFRVNSDSDYGAEFNDPNMYYYHLWITKNEYLIHITSSGMSSNAQEYVSNAGQIILSKF